MNDYELLKRIRELEAGTEARVDWWGWFRRHWDFICYVLILVVIVLIAWWG